MLEKIIPVVLGSIFGFLLCDAYHDSKDKKNEELSPVIPDNNVTPQFDENKIKSEIKEELKGELKNELKDEIKDSGKNEDEK